MSVTDAPADEFELSPTETRPVTATTVADAFFPPAELAKPQRLASLDIFRGITIVAMLIVNNPGSARGGHPYDVLEHAPWHGWTMTDLIFPFFLFIVGVAIPFSFAKRLTTDSRGEMFLHIWARALALVLLGLLLQAIPWINITMPTMFVTGYKMLTALHVLAYLVIAAGLIGLLVPWPWRRVALLMPVIVAIALFALGWGIYFANVRAYGAGLTIPKLGNGIFTPSQMRFPGVLQRIGICYGVAASIALYAGWRTVLFSLIVFCGAFSWLMFTAPGHADSAGRLDKDGNFAHWIDEKVFDRTQTQADGKVVKVASHTYGEYSDPEGLVSTLPAIGSVLIGILVGYSLRSPNRTNVEKCARLLANGVLVTIAGVLLSWWLMPINKKIWTPSFTVFTAGMGMLTLGAIFYITDIKGRRAWAWPFKVYGMNAIAAYVFVGILVRVASMIKIAVPAGSTGASGDGKTSLWRFCQVQAADAVRHADMAIGRLFEGHDSMSGLLATPGNCALAFSIGIVLVILLPLMLMHAFKIYLKV